MWAHGCGLAKSAVHSVVIDSSPFLQIRQEYQIVDPLDLVEPRRLRNVRLPFVSTSTISRTRAEPPAFPLVMGTGSRSSAQRSRGTAAWPAWARPTRWSLSPTPAFG